MNVEARVLLAQDGLAVVNLRFAQYATIDSYDAPFDVDVICISDSGSTAVGEDEFPFSAGETIRWPKNHDHCRWTTGNSMETIMIERHGV